MSQATTRLLAEPTIPPYLPHLPDGKPEVELTYLEQAIPSPYGMPPYELLLDIMATSFDSDDYLQFQPSIDQTGIRVDAYYEFMKILRTTRRLKHLVPFKPGHNFRFQHDEHTESMNVLQVSKKLKPNADKHARRIAGDECTWYHHLLKIKYEHPKVWRGTLPAAKLLIPPVSPEDETTNKGAANVVMSLLLLHGIVKAVDSDGANGDVSKMRLAPNYKEKYMMLVGDGLSQVRVKSLEDLVKNSSFWFSNQQETAHMIHEALGQVINITGDLHGGRFHFLASIYNLYYGSIIQFCQHLLKWKRIRGTDVTKCYQQAAGLAMMISDEIERQLLATFFHEVRNNAGNLESFNAELDAREFAVKVAKDYRSWLVTKSRQSNDEVFVMAVNFVLMMEMYLDFRTALNTGDAIMIECLYREFLPIFFVTRKRNYIEIVMSMMDTLYGKISNRNLQLVRVNRTIPLYNGVDRQGLPMASWALDGIVELVQKYYHQMNFRSEAGWASHSANLMLTNKGRRFAQLEYTRLKSEVANEAKFLGLKDNTAEMERSVRNRRASAIKCREKEHLAIAEYMQLLNVSNERPGRKYVRKEFIEALGKVTTKMEDESEEERSKRKMREAMTEEEKVMSEVIDEIYEMADNFSASERTNSGNSETELAAELDPATVGARGDEDDDNDDDDGNNNDDGPIDTSLAIGRGSGTIKVRLASLNRNSLKDVFGEGKRMMEKRKLGVTRFYRKQRMERQRAFMKRLKESTDSDRDHRYEEGMARWN